MSSVSYVNREAPLQADGVATLLQGEASGVAFDMLENIVLVKDAGTPANDAYGDIPTLVTTSRSTVGYRFNDLGLLEEVPANTARFQYDHITRRPIGLLSEPVATFLTKHCQDLTQVEWVATNITPSKDQVGLFGTENSASSITATSANGTILQAITSASTSRSFSAYLKRLVGTGAVEMTMDGGATWVDVTVPSGNFKRVDIPTQTLADPSFGFRLAVSGDQIAVDLAYGENGAVASVSPHITTTAAPLTRGPETHTFSLANTPWSDTAGTVYIEIESGVASSVSTTIGEINDGTGSEVHRFLVAATSAYQILDGGALVSNVSITNIAYGENINRYCATFGPNFAQGALNGKSGSADTSLTLPTCTNFQIGGSLNGIRLRGFIRKLIFIPRTSTEAEIAALSLVGWPGTSPDVNVAPNADVLSYSDYAGTKTATVDYVSIVRPISGDPNGFDAVTPGMRLEFVTSAPTFTVHMTNTALLNQALDTNDHVLIYADGVLVREAILPDGGGDLAYQIDFTTAEQRTISVVAPYGGSISHRGITVPNGYSVSLAPSRDALPSAVFCGGSRVNGYDAKGPNVLNVPRETWTELLCINKGWQQFNLGAAGRELVSADGTLAGDLNPDIAFLQADTNDLFAQTSLVDYKAKLTAFISAFRAGAPTCRLYVITSIWIPASIDNMTIKIADYRTAAAEALTAIGDANNIIVDGLTLVTNSTSSIPDGLHPNEVGSGEWATNIAAVVSVS